MSVLGRVIYVINITVNYVVFRRKVENFRLGSSINYSKQPCLQGWSVGKIVDPLRTCLMNGISAIHGVLNSRVSAEKHSDVT